MDFSVVYFNGIDQETWDKWVGQVPESTYYHAWDWLSYCSRFDTVEKHLSFVLLDHDSRVIAICPLAITFDKRRRIREISFAGLPVGVPSIANLKHRLRKRVLDYVFNMINEYVIKYGVKQTKMVCVPLNLQCCSGGTLCHKYSFELVRYHMLYNINNTIIIDLECDEETLLNNISKYQRRHIKRGAKKGISVKAFNRDYNYAQLEELFHQYQHVHYQAAGRITRSQGTWDAMYEAAVSGKGSLFVSYMGNTPISYLYCGEFSCMAFGFSQANVELYEKEFSPRHLLEWEAIRYYKKKGFKYYEIGERFYGPGLFKIPSDKEISISVMKERYGGFFLPKITWIGYHDEAFMKDDLMDRMGELIRKRWQT